LALQADDCRQRTLRFMCSEIIVDSKDDTAEGGMYTLEEDVFSELDFCDGWGESSYHDAKREDVGRFIESGLEICLWAAPVVVAGHHSFNASAFGEVGCVFKVDYLDLFNDRVLAIVAAVDHDVVGFDV
jgi:hypothetical protein